VRFSSSFTVRGRAVARPRLEFLLGHTSGLLATKPYVSGGAYIQRMSDYCTRCPYDPKQRTGARACPFSALYWDFLERHRHLLDGNPRLAIAYRQLGRMKPEAKAAISTNAKALLANMEKI